MVHLLGIAQQLQAETGCCSRESGFDTSHALDRFITLFSGESDDLLLLASIGTRHESGTEVCMQGK